MTCSALIAGWLKDILGRGTIFAFFEPPINIATVAPIVSAFVIFSPSNAFDPLSTGDITAFVELSIMVMLSSTSFDVTIERASSSFACTF